MIDLRQRDLGYRVREFFPCRRYHGDYDGDGGGGGEGGVNCDLSYRKAGSSRDA